MSAHGRRAGRLHARYAATHHDHLAAGERRLWGIALGPAHERVDGTVDHTDLPIAMDAALVAADAGAYCLRRAGDHLAR